MIGSKTIKEIIMNNPEPIRERLSTYVDVADIITTKHIHSAVNDLSPAQFYDVLNVPFNLKSSSNHLADIWKGEGGTKGASIISLLMNEPDPADDEMSDKESTAKPVFDALPEIPKITPTMWAVMACVVIALIIFIVWQIKKA